MNGPGRKPSRLATRLAFGLVLMIAINAEAADYPLPVDRIRKFVAEFLKESQGSSAVSVAYANLGGEKEPQVLLYFSGSEWCGSGGCTLIVLQKSAGALEPVGHTTVTRLPISVLSSRSHGWHDLAVWSAGGGGVPHQALLAFDGKHYPGNPSMAPPIVAPDDDFLVGDLLVWKEAKPGALQASTFEAAERDYRQREMELAAAGNCDASQASMNLCSLHRFKQADVRLNVAYDWLRGRGEGAVAGKRLQESQRAWLRFVDADCLYQVGPREDSGTTWPLEQNNCMADHTLARVRHLKKLLDCSSAGCPGH
ncbi:MAG: DUF1311 domain-containing protein [Pseudomonadota bacterium]|nr:DUF1311 domain-containing protein [Pseudomonadota bacterium]